MRLSRVIFTGSPVKSCAIARKWRVTPDARRNGAGGTLPRPGGPMIDRILSPVLSWLLSGQPNSPLVAQMGPEIDYGG